MCPMSKKKANVVSKKRRDNVLRIRLTDDERKLLDDYATQMSLDTSTWARMELMQKVRGQKQ